MTLILFMTTVFPQMAAKALNVILKLPFFQYLHEYGKMMIKYR